MVGSAPATAEDSAGGFFPVAVYARRARKPLPAALDTATPSWDVLGTNLSVKNADGSFSTQPERLLMMDARDFQALGIGLDDLIEAYMQTVLAAAAIDALAAKLVSRSGNFRYNLFRSINPGCGPDGRNSGRRAPKKRWWLKTRRRRRRRPTRTRASTWMMKPRGGCGRAA